MIRNLLALVGLGAVALATAVGLQASRWGYPSDKPRALAVSFAGLDLATDEGKALLQGRIAAAVSRVCGRAESRDLKAKAAERRCRRDAWIGTEPQVAAAIDKAENRDRMAAERAQQLAGLPAAPVAGAPQMVQQLPPGYRPGTGWRSPSEWKRSSYRRKWRGRRS